MSSQIVTKFRHFGVFTRNLSPPALSLRFGSTQIKPEPEPKHEEEISGYLNKDWFRTPQKSDGPRCIDPTYPEVPYESYQARPFDHYDDPQLKRNLGESMHENYELLSTQSFDIETTYTIRYMLAGLGISAAALYGCYKLVNYFDDREGWRKNAVEREYPYLEKYYPSLATKKPQTSQVFNGLQGVGLFVSLIGMNQPQADPNNPVNQAILSKGKLREMAHMASPGERFDPPVENLMIKIAEDFVGKVSQASADLARHRKSKTLEVEDVLLHLERVWDLGIPGFTAPESRPSGKAGPSEAHLQRLNFVQREQAKH